ncbi:Imm51 family immunity protein [Actinoplanes sp. NPDC023801]|uniref:Imm51 family immunity protein n=1 Tax=Actinoplanes sp. NPDC023801 TaxID=3154595 RepID=UPI0033C7E45C
MTEDLSLFPFRIDTSDDATQQLWLFDGDMEQVEDVFADRGAESNGHGWESLAGWLIDTEMPELADLIWFGSESGTFVAGSSDPAAVRRLAERLHEAFHDRTLLARLITEATLD